VCGLIVAVVGMGLGTVECAHRKIILKHVALKSNPSIPMGSLGQLTKLYLSRNDISDPGMVSFSDAIAWGALASLRELWLSHNQISDPGMVSFSDAVARGALPNLDWLNVYDNNIGEGSIFDFERSRLFSYY
jgi:Leucine-rich repeat (LRR) protein